MINFIKKHKEILADFVLANVILAYVIGTTIGLHYYPMLTTFIALYPIAIGALVLIFQLHRYPDY